MAIKLLAEKCKHDDKQYFDKIMHAKSHAEWYMLPQEAKKHKLIDHIRVPEMKTVISVDIQFDK